MQLWQVMIVFGGGPLALFGAIWALVWVTTKPVSVPPGVAQPSDAPSGGVSQTDLQEAGEAVRDAHVERTGEADDETGAEA